MLKKTINLFYKNKLKHNACKLVCATTQHENDQCGFANHSPFSHTKHWMIGHLLFKATFCTSSEQLRDHPSKTSGRKGGACPPKWTTSDGGRGSAKNRTSRNNFFWPETTFFGQKKLFFGVSVIRIGVRNPPHRGSQYILVRIAIYFAFRTFLRSIWTGRPR